VVQHLGRAVQAAQACLNDETAKGGAAQAPLDDFIKAHQTLRALMRPFLDTLPADVPLRALLVDAKAQTDTAHNHIEALRGSTWPLVASHGTLDGSIQRSAGFHEERLSPFAEAARQLVTVLDHTVRMTLRLLDAAEKDQAARDDDRWPTREIGKARKALDAARELAVDQLKQVRHFQRHAAWLIERFPNARYRDVQGLCKVVTRAEIEVADWSLTPGRYVGVAAVVEDEDFDFAEAMRGIRAELEELDSLAAATGRRVISSLAKLEA
jgi:type I restriction enzyme M protein